MARPRGFDEQEVLACAMRMFWRGGYEATTTRAIEAGTGVGIRSLANTFGEKDELFVRALRMYREMAGGILDQTFDPPDGNAIVAFFSGMGAPTEDAEDVRNAGCLMVNTTFELTRTSPAIRAEVEGYRGMFRDRFAEALRADGVADADARAEYLVGSLWGALSQIRLMGSTEAAKPMIDVVIATVEGWRQRG